MGPTWKGTIPHRARRLVKVPIESPSKRSNRVVEYVPQYNEEIEPIRYQKPERLVPVQPVANPAPTADEPDDMLPECTLGSECRFVHWDDIRLVEYPRDLVWNHWLSKYQTLLWTIIINGVKKGRCFNAFEGFHPRPALVQEIWWEGWEFGTPNGFLNHL